MLSPIVRSQLGGLLDILNICILARSQVWLWDTTVGPLIMFTKMFALVGVIMWVRFSYPRFREDQLQTFAWKVLIPLALANTAATAILKVVF